MKEKSVVLDLDQTIISAEADEEYDFKKHKTRAKKFKYHDMDSYYIVFERPGLQRFLDYLFSNFNITIWTAASKDYALFIIEKIILAGKSDRHIDWIFFSYHCDISKKLKGGSKDLRIFWEDYKLPGYTADNTIIIDDYDEVYYTQPGNCVISPPFEFTQEDSEDDKYLEQLEKHLEKFLHTKSKEPARLINKGMKLKPFSRR
jgi:TFIIF-interacting CTD phosphatase-like protein